MYRYTLDKSSKKFNCPGCGQKRFVRFVDNQTGGYLPSSVGRCDRESACGYQYTSKDFFRDNNELNERYEKSRKRIFSQIEYQLPKPDYLETNHILETLADYDKNSFVQFLLLLFPFDAEKVWKSVKDYFIGTYKEFTCFPKISMQKKICSAKLMKFDRETGKRLKTDYSISSLQSELKRAGKIKSDFETDKMIFFGEHLMRSEQNKPVGIVEAEKTAIIASMLLPDLVWIAAGSKQFLKVEKLKRFGNRKILLYPDADGFAQWQTVARQARFESLTVNVSALIEKRAQTVEKANQVDLADYLIDEQITALERGEAFAKVYNAKLDYVLSDDGLFDDFNSILDEQKAVLIFNGGLSAAEAETLISSKANFRQVILGL